MTLAAAAIGLAGVGGGWSVDHALGWFSPPGWIGLGIALAGGFGGAAGLLAACWRPVTTTATTGTTATGTTATGTTATGTTAVDTPG